MDTQSFQKARIILASWYVGILAVILFAFSFVLYTSEQHDFVRIIVMRDFNSRIPRILTRPELTDVEKQLTEIRRAFLLNLITVDAVVLFLGGGLSYFLAGKTLRPIQETFEKQKLFLADVSHEIRTPLAAIQTATEVSLRSKNKSKEEYRHVLVQVYEESKRLTKMANDLLLLSRMETARPIAFSPVNLSKIIKDSVATFESAAKEKQIHLILQMEKHVVVQGDENGLMQLAMIFLDNAIKYTKNTGTITIALSKSPRTKLSFRDTGIGISEKDTKRIFERFYQADTSRANKGNGLGLAIAQQIIQLHKARVSVESSPKGSLFTIIFPV